MVKYHYSYRFFTYPVRRGGEPRAGSRFCVKRPAPPGVTRPGTVAGGEFDWGGTPVKRVPGARKDCPKNGKVPSIHPPDPGLRPEAPGEVAGSGPGRVLPPLSPGSARGVPGARAK
ncbi:hypothetical protein Q5P01_000717 [Channa striata]|uniref:Uncharacterized protein n=1 Tax=Channa striata TaxID=64152 RepID=A0AA88IX28_CHASR|nr:hypothetical protein Q5P01_000717 [Channa striata]